MDSNRAQGHRCSFEGHKRAAKVQHPLSEKIKADGAKILDEAVFAVTPKGKARVYDLR